jgi:hypothetical protein
MKTFTSIIAAGFISTMNIRQRMTARQSYVIPRMHVALSCRTQDNYDAMTVKQLRKILTERKVKGRSKLTRKADIIGKLRSL